MENDKLEISKQVEELALGKESEISNRAGCMRRRNKCMQDALWSFGAGWRGVGVGRRKGWRRTREKRWN